MAIKLTEVKEHLSLLTSSGLTIHFPAATSLMGMATGATEHLSVHTQSPCVFEHCPLCVCVVCRLPTSPWWDKVMLLSFFPFGNIWKRLDVLSDPYFPYNLWFCYPDCPYCNLTVFDCSSVELPEDSSIFFLQSFFGGNFSPFLIQGSTDRC